MAKIRDMKRCGQVAAGGSRPAPGPRVRVWLAVVARRTGMPQNVSGLVRCPIPWVGAG
jgi:hypothetical protein